MRNYQVNVKHFATLIVLLSLVILLSLSLGYTNSSLRDIFDLLVGQIDQASSFIIIQIRLPRILVCLLGGASLALAGVLLQTLTKNALADSGILGINAGAGLAIAIIIGSLHTSALEIINFLPLLAMFGGIATILLVYGISLKKNRGINPTRLIIAGVGVSSMLSGIMVSVISSSDDNQMDYIISWLSGEITGNDWATLSLFAPALLVIWCLTFSRSKSLNIMNLNEQTALALGLNLQKERLITLILATALASISVVLVGNITFIGLLAGHIAKGWLGSQHQISLPAAMLIGMILLTSADTIARVLLVGTGIPTGIIVSIIGAPYFLYLMISLEK
ncbi:FecCD family ABC transporter permease [Streptococcus dentapri]|uniref:FecCD family ABC transporter permease n=1 Tax=Streptococcus dentapri TaxID=573564 RepID=A0ABV8D3J2_9STRE